MKAPNAFALRNGTRSNVVVRLRAHQGPDSSNGLHALLGLLVLGCPGRECGLGRLSRGKHRIQVAYHGIQVSGEAAQRAHRQLERAVTRRIVARRRISRFSLRWLAVGGV